MGSASSASAASGSARCSSRRSSTSPACSTASTSASRSTVSRSASGSWTGSSTTPSSERPNGAYDATAEGSLPAAVGKQSEPGEFPGTVLSVVREDPPRGVASRAAWQVQHEILVLSHYLLLCARRGTVQVESDNFRRLLRCAYRAWTPPGNSREGQPGCRDNGRDGHFVAAPRMVLAAGVATERGGSP